MKIFKNILEKLKLSFIWKENSKKTIKNEKGLQISQDSSGVVNMINFTQNITAEKLQEFVDSDTQTLMQSAGNRFLSEQAWKHENWSNAIKSAELQKIKDPKELSKDWYLRWSEIAQNTSKEDLRIILSKILSGEIEKPNTFSYRTLDFIKNFTASELLLFKKLAILSSGNRVYISKSNLNDGFFDFSYDQIMKLIELGFLQHSITTVAKFGDLEKDSIIPVSFRSFGVRIFITDNKKTDFNLPILSFTSIGIDIANLLEAEDRDKVRFAKYLEEFIEFAKTKGMNLAKS